jgi:hypothetical protein
MAIFIVLNANLNPRGETVSPRADTVNTFVSDTSKKQVYLNRYLFFILFLSFLLFLIIVCGLSAESRTS